MHGGDFLSASAKAVFRVGGLKGDEGGREIEHTLSQIDGVRAVRVSTGDGAVGVDFDPGVIGEDFIKRTLNSLGYSPYLFPEIAGPE
jgi:copper chaperone CopZ